jgi:phage terminase small subunit
MKACTPRQRAFVEAMLVTGGNNHKLCAMMAGYTGNDNTLRVTAHRLAHDSNVLAAIREEGDRRIRASVVMATSRLVSIAENSTDEKVALKAIDMVLNRSGLHALTEHKVSIERPTDGVEIKQRIVALAKELGLDPAKLLGHNAQMSALPAPEEGETVEAEFIEITGREGLEDLL